MRWPVRSLEVTIVSGIIGKQALAIIVLLTAMAVSPEAPGRPDGPNRMSRPELVLACVPISTDVEEACLRYSVVNAGRTAITLRKHGLPFRATLSGKTYLLVLCDGSPIVNPMLDLIEGGVPAIDDLSPITIDPGGSYSAVVPLGSVLGNDPLPGAYDITGIWRVNVIENDKAQRVSVQVPLFSLVVPHRGT